MAVKLNRQDAEDIRSDTYETIRKQIDQEGSFIIEIGAYFNTVARNESLKLAKRTRKNQKHAPGILLELYGQTKTGHEIPVRDPETGEEPGLHPDVTRIIKNLTGHQMYILEKHSEISAQKAKFDRSWRQIRDVFRKRGTKIMDEQILRQNDQCYREALGLLENIFAALQKRKQGLSAGQDNNGEKHPETDHSIALLEEMIQVRLKTNKVYIEYLYFCTTWSPDGQALHFLPPPYPIETLTEKIRQNSISLLNHINRLKDILNRHLAIENHFRKRKKIEYLLNNLIAYKKELNALLASPEMPAASLHGDSREIRLDWWFFNALDSDGINYSTINAANTQHKKALNRSKTIRNLTKVGKK